MEWSRGIVSTHCDNIRESVVKRSLAAAVASFAALQPAAEAAEAAGVDRVWATELRARDVMIRALYMAAATSRLQVGTGIAYAFTRHPLAMAAAAVEGQAASGGRFTVGIGAGTPHTRGEFGLSFDHPAARLAEYAEIMRRAVDTEDGLDFHGRFYDITMPGFRFGHPRELLDSVCIYGAALNPLTVTTLSRICDGLALHPFGHWQGYLADIVLPSVKRGAADNPRGAPALATWIIACALPDAGRARRLARAQVALYAAQPGFASFFETTPWARTAERIRNRAHLGSGPTDWAGLGEELVTDDLLDGVAIAGSADEVADRVMEKERELEDLGVDELTLQIPGVALPVAETQEILSSLVSAVSR
jgi:alkanesulfonate monooxygenase SsuD/methylene tetrahydromethanopterin reductase-like flavin-dependent oxidoreductase (luciferase family)